MRGGGKAAVEVRLQSVTGELPFVEMLPGKKKKSQCNLNTVQKKERKSTNGNPVE